MAEGTRIVPDFGLHGLEPNKEHRLTKRDIDKEPDWDGKWVPVELNDLITAVYVSPTSPPWFYELVREVSGKYGLAKDIRQSSLADKPIW